MITTKHRSDLHKRVKYHWEKYKSGMLMNKALLVMAIVTLALFGYAVKTAHLPPASVSYQEVFYKDNETVVIVERDEWGLFEMNIDPKVKGFELSITFPEGTEYLVRYNGKEYKGTNKFKLEISEGGTMYVRFGVPQELADSIYHENAKAEIKIHMEKMPFWRDDYTLHLIPREND